MFIHSFIQGFICLILLIYVFSFYLFIWLFLLLFFKFVFIHYFKTFIYLFIYDYNYIKGEVCWHGLYFEWHAGVLWGKILEIWLLLYIKVETLVCYMMPAGSWPVQPVQPVSRQEQGCSSDSYFHCQFNPSIVSHVKRLII